MTVIIFYRTHSTPINSRTLVVEAIANKFIPVTSTEDIGTYHYSWTVQDWSALSGAVYSPSFYTGGLQWRIKLYPLGAKRHAYISVFTELMNPPAKDEEHIDTQTLICFSDPTCPYRYTEGFYTSKYTKKRHLWGLFEIVKKDVIIKGTRSEKAFLVDDTIVCTAIIRLSKSSPGFDVPIPQIQQQMSCRGNSFEKTPKHINLMDCDMGGYTLQIIHSMYSIKSLQKAVYQIPIENNDPCDNVVLALQRLFYRMKYSSKPISTEELTQSMEWNCEISGTKELHFFCQLMLCTMEAIMEGTSHMDLVKDLLTGTLKTVIKCKYVNYRVSTSEGYTDLSLGIEGCHTLIDSLNRFTEEGLYENENKIKAGRYGQEEATENVSFKTIPDVLHILLNRNIKRNEDVETVNTHRYEFPLQVDLSPYISPNSDKNECYTYNLHRILDYNYDGTTGTYYTYVKPTMKDAWFLYGNDKVVPVNMKDTLRDLYGGEGSHHHVHMLVYIRETVFHDIMSDVTVEDIPSQLIEQIKAEDGDLLSTLTGVEYADAYMQINLYDDKYFLAHKNFEGMESKVENSVSGIVYSQKDNVVSKLIHQIAERISYPLEAIRFWVMAERSDGTTKPVYLLSDVDMGQDLESIKAQYAPDEDCLKIYLDRANKATSGKILFSLDIADKILVFVKYFDILTQVVRGIGALYLHKDKTFEELTSYFITLTGMKKNTSVQLYGEIGLSEAELLCTYYTPSEANIKDGDTICIQKQIQSRKEAEHMTRNNLPPNYQKYIQKSMAVVSIVNENKKVKLSLQGEMPRSDIVKELTRVLNSNPTRAYSIVSASQDSDLSSPQSATDVILNVVVQNTDSDSSSSTPQAVTVTIPQAVSVSSSQESIIYVNVFLYYPSFNNRATKILAVPNNASVEDIYTHLKTITKLKSVHVYGVQDRRYQTLDRSMLITNIAATTHIHAEPADENELDVKNVCHFISVNYHPSKHLVVFRFLVIKDELFIKTKIRLIKRLGLSDTSINSFTYYVMHSSQSNTIDSDNYKLSEHSLHTDILCMIKKEE